jgi:hypothetical protein
MILRRFWSLAMKPVAEVLRARAKEALAEEFGPTRVPVAVRAVRLRDPVVRAEVELQLGLSPAAIEEGLFADLKSQQRLIEFKDPYLLGPYWNSAFLYSANSDGTVSNQQSGLCLDVNGASTANGAAAFPESRRPSRHWALGAEPAACRPRCGIICESRRRRCRSIFSRSIRSPAKRPSTNSSSHALPAGAPLA